jgi:hypothetical protein
MLWVAPSEKDSASAALEKRLWHAAKLFRANSGMPRDAVRRASSPELHTAHSWN